MNLKLTLSTLRSILPNFLAVLSMLLPKNYYKFRYSFRCSMTSRTPPLLLFFFDSNPEIDNNPDEKHYTLKVEIKIQLGDINIKMVSIYILIFNTA